MREIADQLAIRLLLRLHARFARDAQLLADRAQLRKQRHTESVNARNGARERDGLASSAHVGQHVARRIIPMDDAGILERALQFFALGEQAEKRLPDHAARAGGEEVFGGGMA